jgi:hypothetical protein
MVNRSALTIVSAAAFLFGPVPVIGPANANVIFDYNGGVQTFDVGQTGVYDITAYGGQGGAAGGFAGGGLGGEIGGDVTLAAGQVLTILVGQQDGDGGFNPFSPLSGGGGGGGGGTFVVLGPPSVSAATLRRTPPV